MASSVASASARPISSTAVGRPPRPNPFGSETAGLPAEIRDGFADDRRVRLPMRAGQRSLNLSNAVAVAVFEAWRQTGYTGGS